MRIGKHTVTHCDLMDLDINTLLDGQKVNLMYSDPPWGEGNLKYWQTMNYKNNDVEKNEVNLTKFLAKIMNIAKEHVTEMVFIEYGVRWREYILQLAKSNNLIHLETIPLEYRSGSRMLPLDLHVFSKKQMKLSKEYIDAVTNTTGYNTLVQAVTPFAKQGMTLIDPCCGMGYSAQISCDTGMAFRGNELNAKRLDKTIKRLRKNENL